MSLPIVILFERHWDTIPKHLIQTLLPKLAKQGYDTFCIETAEHLSSDAIIANHKTALEEASTLKAQAEGLLKQVKITKQLSLLGFSELSHLMRMYVSSKHYQVVAERIKDLPASKLFESIFKITRKHAITVKGIDLSMDQALSEGHSKRVRILDRFEDQRVSIMFNNLSKLQRKQKGVIFYVVRVTLIIYW